jgi:hypothetical protein
MNNLTFNAEDHSYYLDGVRLPSVTQILRGVGLIDFSHVPPERLEASMKFGTAVHRACELYDFNNLDEASLDPALRPYLDAWIKCRKDTMMIIEAIEEKVVSVKYRFAGMLDRRVVMDKCGILDIKTSVDISPATKLQLAGYELAYNEMAGNKNRSCRRWVVLLKDDGTYKIEEHKNKGDANIFLSVLSIYNFKGGTNGNR